MYVCMCPACVHTWMQVPTEGDKGVRPPKLVVSYLMWGSRTELRSSASAVHALNCCTLSLVPTTPISWKRCLTLPRLAANSMCIVTRDDLELLLLPLRSRRAETTGVFPCTLFIGGWTQGLNMLGTYSTSWTTLPTSSFLSSCIYVHMCVNLSVCLSLCLSVYADNHRF